MKEGYWMNWRTGRIVEIHEHEIDIRNSETSQRLGVPKSVSDQFGRFVIQRDRDKFLPWLMRKVPLMRIRGHGTAVTFQYASIADQIPHSAVRKWARKFAGPCMLLNIHNLQTKKTVEKSAETLLKKRKKASGARVRKEILP